MWVIKTVWYKSNSFKKLKVFPFSCGFENSFQIGKIDWNSLSTIITNLYSINYTFFAQFSFSAVESEDMLWSVHCMTSKWITDGSLGWGSSFAKITWCSLSFLRDQMESAARGFWESQNQSNRNLVQYCNLQYFVVCLRSETCFIHAMAMLILFKLGCIWSTSNSSKVKTGGALNQKWPFSKWVKRTFAFIKPFDPESGLHRME